jgi:hypothetical protein
MKSFIICSVHHILLECLNKSGWYGRGMHDAWGRFESVDLKADRPLCRPRRRCKGNVSIELEIGNKNVDWIDLSKGIPLSCFANTTMNLQVPQKAGEYLEQSDCWFWRRILLHGLCLFGKIVATEPDVTVSRTTAPFFMRSCMKSTK